MGLGQGRGYGFGRGYGYGIGRGKGAFSSYACVKFIFFAFNVIFWVSMKVSTLIFAIVIVLFYSVVSMCNNIVYKQHLFSHERLTNAGIRFAWKKMHCNASSSHSTKPNISLTVTASDLASRQALRLAVSQRYT
jgi:predicted lysophospholipase L1 biosynthesis ABC-type transport system permease subunit